MKNPPIPMTILERLRGGLQSLSRARVQNLRLRYVKMYWPRWELHNNGAPVGRLWELHGGSFSRHTYIMRIGFWSPLYYEIQE